MTDLIVLCKSCHEIADRERVQEREARGRAARDSAAFHTWMEKKYGEDYEEGPDDAEEFYDWLENKQSSYY